MTDPLLLFLPSQQHLVSSHAHDVCPVGKVLLGDGDPGVRPGSFDRLDEFDVFFPGPAVVPIDARVDVTSETFSTLPRFTTRDHLSHANPNARLGEGRGNILELREWKKGISKVDNDECNR